MFELTIGDYSFILNSAQELAAYMHELCDQPIEDTLKMARELKRDQPHCIMQDNAIYHIEKVK